MLSPEENHSSGKNLAHNRIPHVATNVSNDKMMKKILKDYQQLKKTKYEKLLKS